jgi:hypothetical protein
MEMRVGRRSVLGMAAGALAPALAACGGKHAPGTVATPVASSSGPRPQTVMIIRHAEKPVGAGAPYGVTQNGDRDAESLIVRGWTRAGALVQLFAPCDPDASPVPTRPGIVRPATIFASDPGAHNSRRPMQTVIPLAKSLGMPVDLRFRQGQEAELVAALPGVASPVLIAWEHENIGAIIDRLGAVTPTPPKTWPDDRFDVVYVFTRTGDGWNFTQVPQVLLAEDATTPIA